MIWGLDCNPSRALCTGLQRFVTRRNVVSFLPLRVFARHSPSRFSLGRDPDYIAVGAATPWDPSPRFFHL